MSQTCRVTANVETASVESSRNMNKMRTSRFRTLFEGNPPLYTEWLPSWKRAYCALTASVSLPPALLARYDVLACRIPHKSDRRATQSGCRCWKPEWLGGGRALTVIRVASPLQRDAPEGSP